MPIGNVTLPAIDQNLVGTWSEGDIDQYNKLPYYFARATAEYQKYRESWAPFLKNIPWTPNAGDTMKQVGIERTPVLRQMAFPSLLRDTPSTDIIYMKERTTTAQLMRHRFRTPEFGFLPSFQDFIANKVDPYREDLNRQIMIYTEQFYRTAMFYHSPYMYVCGHGLISCPTNMGNSAGTAAGSKTSAWMATDVFPKCKSHLSFQELFKALNCAEQEVGATPFEGNLLNNGWSAPMDGKFALLGSNEVWNQFIDDPWVKENKPLNLNIITDGLRGDIFGRIRYRTECYGLRFKVDDKYSPSLPAPEGSIINGAEDGRTAPLGDYSKDSQFAVAWLVGGPSYQIIKVGPPPSDFTGKDVNGIIGMDWNGKIQMTRNFLVPEKDANGATVMETNSWGEKVRLQAQVAMGIVGYNRFNCIPIVYQRKVGLTTLTS